MAGVSVCYIVDNVDAAIAFYRRELGFREVMHPAPSFAMLARGDLRLVLSAPDGARVRNDIVVGVGGKQILLEDPSGNPHRAVRANPSRGWIDGCERAG